MVSFKGSKSAVSSFLAFLLSLIFLSTNVAFAKHKDKGRPGSPRDQYSDSFSNGNSAEDDSDLVRAVRDRRDVNFVVAAEMLVVQVLPDDTQGLPHQKWIVQLSDGSKVNAVYNSDMGARIPLKVGDKVALAGQFKMTNIGPLIHWLHYDPRQLRPDGYVVHNGITYGGRQ